MAESDATSQPSMTATSTIPATIPMTMASTPAVEITPAGSMVSPGSTSHPASIEPGPDATENTQTPSMEIQTRTVSQASQMVEDADSNINSYANSTTPAQPNQPPSPPPIPETAVTFLLVTGKRRTMTFPSSSTIGRVKELVWNSWPADWSDDRPPTPNFLRIIYLGKLLQDEDVLESALHTLFPESQPCSLPTIVHISIRPVAPSTIAADDMKKKKRAGRISISRNGASSSGEGADEDESRGGCCCIIC